MRPDDNPSSDEDRPAVVLEIERCSHVGQLASKLDDADLNSANDHHHRHCRFDLELIVHRLLLVRTVYELLNDAVAVVQLHPDSLPALFVSDIAVKCVEELHHEEDLVNESEGNAFMGRVIIFASEVLEANDLLMTSLAFSLVPDIRIFGRVEVLVGPEG